MTGLPPLETLYDAPQSLQGVSSYALAPLPSELATVYGPLWLPLPATRPYVYANFVSTLDGVVSLNEPGRSGGKEISGFNEHDRLVMGILRAMADAVIVGAGTLRAVPHHQWTAEYVYPTLAGPFNELRSVLGKHEPPLNVIVSARGAIDLSLPVFQSPTISVLVVTTAAGARQLAASQLPPSVQIAAVQDDGPIKPLAILETVGAVRAGDRFLLEGGPKLMGDFLAESLLDELFLTVAPQIAGREPSVPRPGLVEGHSFAPTQPLWGTLLGIKRAGSHLFLRYAFAGA